MFGGRGGRGCRGSASAKGGRGSARTGPAIVARAHDAGKARRRIAASHSLAGEKPRKRNAVGRRYTPDACVLKAGPMTRPASTSVAKRVDGLVRLPDPSRHDRSEEHTSELTS